MRLEYAQHYGIPYPRLHHAPQFQRRYILDAPSPDSAAGAGVPSARSGHACRCSACLYHHLIVQVGCVLAAMNLHALHYTHGC